MYFNRRRRRYGHLFQNRYKSILCQEDPYFKELVRYIHLNPLRAKVVDGIVALDKYPYSGHSALMGKVERKWQDTEYVLGWFGKGIRQGRSNYHDFIKEGVSMGKRPELTGGGLVRSAGGWMNLMEMRRAKIFVKGDERILGQGHFVEQILQESNEAFEKKTLLKSQNWDLDKLAAHVAKLLGIDVCTGDQGDACVISGSVRAMKAYLKEIDPDEQKGHTVKKTRFGEILRGLNLGAAYGFDKESYKKFYPLARKQGLPVKEGNFSEMNDKGFRFFTVKLKSL